MQNYWGVDLGGTKIEAVILSAPSPDAIIIRRRIATEAHLGYQHIISQITKLINQLRAETGLKPEKIGFCTPGTIDPGTATMKNSNMVCINGQPFRDDLIRALGVDVLTTNDANCFALSEATMGSVQDVIPDFRMVFGVILGTGVGGGVVFRGLDGRAVVQAGRQGIGGEWGHNILEENGYPCYCGKRGCNEQVISGPALERFYREQSGESHNLKAILDRYQTGSDTFAAATVERLLENFGRSISTIVNMLDPDAIVLGGGVGNVDLLYTEGVERAKKYVFNSGRLNTLFLKPKLGDSAGVFGAALL
ncbi:ROK family protein [Spirosoma daeguense]